MKEDIPMENPFDTIDADIIAHLVEQVELGVQDTLADNPDMCEDEVVYEIARNVVYGKRQIVAQEVFHGVGLHGFTPDLDSHHSYCPGKHPDTMYTGGSECVCWQDPDPADALTFDEVEAAGLDGTLRNM